MRAILLALLLPLMLLPGAAGAQMMLPGPASQTTGEGLEIGTSTSEIAITSDFHGADLRRADMTRVNLTFADLTGANLADADLQGADLSRAVLTGANLAGVNLEGADLDGANLRGASGLDRVRGWDKALNREKIIH